MYKYLLYIHINLGKLELYILLKFVMSVRLIQAFFVELRLSTHYFCPILLCARRETHMVHPFWPTQEERPIWYTRFGPHRSRFNGPRGFLLKGWLSVKPSFAWFYQKGDTAFVALVIVLGVKIAIMVSIFVPTSLKK